MAGECFECGREATVEHHVVPVARGGTKTVSLCGDCHGKAHHANRNMSTSSLTRAALAAKRMAGELCGQVPYGWNATDEGRLVENAAEQKVIRCILELRAAGMSLREIASTLNSQHVATKKGGKWYGETARSVIGSAGNRLWSHSTVQSIIYRESVHGR